MLIFCFENFMNFPCRELWYHLPLISIKIWAFKWVKSWHQHVKRIKYIFLKWVWPGLFWNSEYTGYRMPSKMNDGFVALLWSDHESWFTTKSTLIALTDSKSSMRMSTDCNTVKNYEKTHERQFSKLIDRFVNDLFIYDLES